MPWALCSEPPVPGGWGVVGCVCCCPLGCCCCCCSFVLKNTKVLILKKELIGIRKDMGAGGLGGLAPKSVWPSPMYAFSFFCFFLSSLSFPSFPYLLFSFSLSFPFFFFSFFSFPLLVLSFICHMVFLSHVLFTSCDVSSS